MENANEKQETREVKMTVSILPFQPACEETKFSLKF